MSYLRLSVIALSISTLWTTNSDSIPAQESNLQQIISNYSLPRKDGNRQVALAKDHFGKNVKIADDNITGQKKGTSNISGEETVDVGTRNLTASRRKRDWFWPIYIRPNIYKDSNKRQKLKKGLLKGGRYTTRPTRITKFYHRTTKTTKSEKHENNYYNFNVGDFTMPGSSETESLSGYRDPLSSYGNLELLPAGQNRLYQRDWVPIKLKENLRPLLGVQRIFGIFPSIPPPLIPRPRPPSESSEYY